MRADGEASIGQPDGHQGVVCARRCVLIGALEPLPAAVGCEHARDRIFRVTMLVEDEQRDNRDGQKDCSGRRDGYDAPPAPCRPDGSGEEDAQRSFDRDEPAPGELQKAQLGQDVPERKRKGN